MHIDEDQIEIYLSDFKEREQKEILEFLGLKNAGEGNLDIIPLVYIPKPECVDCTHKDTCQSPFSMKC